MAREPQSGLSRSYSNLLKEIALASRTVQDSVRIAVQLRDDVDDETRSICRKALGAEIADT